MPSQIDLILLHKWANDRFIVSIVVCVSLLCTFHYIKVGVNLFQTVPVVGLRQLPTIPPTSYFWQQEKQSNTQPRRSLAASPASDFHKRPSRTFSHNNFSAISSMMLLLLHNKELIQFSLVTSCLFKRKICSKEWTKLVEKVISLLCIGLQ